MTAQPQHRILIIGEIHVRGYAAGLNANLGHSFNVAGYVKTNSNLDINTATAKSQSKIMTTSDVIILCGGAKNIGKIEAYKLFCCISQFIGKKRHKKC